MKQSILLLSLLALSLPAVAQTYGLGYAYEYDVATSNRIGLNSITKNGILGGIRTEYGQFDASLFEVKIRGDKIYDAQHGAELGYGIAFPIGSVTIGARAGFGKVSNRGLGAPSDTATYKTYSISAGIPITPKLGVSVGYKYRPEGDLDKQEQYSIGLTYFVSNQLQVLGGYRQTRSTGPILNGASLSVRYYF